MTAIRQIASGFNGSVASGATSYLAPANINNAVNATENTRQITYRTAGTISRLAVVKRAGDRTGMVAKSRIAGADGNLQIAFTSTNGLYEDTTHSDAVTAGQAVAFSFAGGTGGTTSFDFGVAAWNWDATGTTTTLLALSQGALTASTTYWSAPGIFPNANTVQSQGEWLVKLPPGVDHVTLRNLYVRAGAGVPTNAISVSLNGATGPGTAPSVSTTAANTTYEDTTNSIQAKDGDKISVKIVTGAGTQGAIGLVSFEVQSDDGVSFMMYGSSTGGAFSRTSYRPLGGGTYNSTTEADVQIPAGALSGLNLSLLTANVLATGTGSGHGLNTAGAAAGTPAQVKVDTAAATGWVTDTANSYAPATVSELLSYTDIFGTANPTVALVAITVSPVSTPASLTLAASSAAGSATLALTAATRLPVAQSAATSSPTLALTAPTQIPLSASAATATGAGTLTTTAPLTLASSASASGSLALAAPSLLTLPGSATAQATLALAAPTTIPLAGATGAATPTLALVAPTLLALAPSAGAGSGLLELRIRALLRPTGDVLTGWQTDASSHAAALDDAVEQPTAPSTAGDEVFTSSAGAVDRVSFDDLAGAQDGIDGALWAYVRAGSAVAVTVELYEGATLLGSTTVNAGDDPGWVSVPFSGLTQSEVDSLEMRLVTT